MNAFETLMLLGLMGLLGLQFLLALRVFRLEKAAGLARSRNRLMAVAACLALGILLGGVAITHRSSLEVAPPLDKRTDELIRQSDALKTRLEKLRVEREPELRAYLRQLLAELDAASSPEEVDLEQQLRHAEEQLANSTKAPPARVHQWGVFQSCAQHALLLLVAVVVAGLAALLLLGDTRYLWPRQWRLFGKRQTAQDEPGIPPVEQLAAAVYEERYEDALAVVKNGNEPAPGEIERLDWLYLRAYAAVQAAFPKETTGDPKNRESLLKDARRDLEAVIHEAPLRHEAAYLLALVFGLQGNYQAALDGFGQVPLKAAPTEPLAHNQSVCLLRLAEGSLVQGNVEQACALFDRVTRLAVMATVIPEVQAKVRLQRIRENLSRKEMKEAAANLAALRGVEGLAEDRRAVLLRICDAYEVMFSLTQADPVGILNNTERFLAAYLPTTLAQPEEEVADEYLDPELSLDAMGLSPILFRLFFYAKATAMAEREVSHGKPLAPWQVHDLAVPLLRALQFEPRQRDVLAVLGGLYFWFLPAKRQKARQWILSAISMGVESQVARRILAEDRAEQELHQEIMECFRSASLRFLQDPTVHQSVRAVLIQELGRFQELHPLLVELEDDTDEEARQPTLQTLQERCTFLAAVVHDLAGKLDRQVDTASLRQIHQDYAQKVQQMASSIAHIVEVERRLMQTLGTTIRYERPTTHDGAETAGSTRSEAG